MEYFGTPSERFLEGRSTNRHDHEFLRINSAVCVSTAVQDVHHGNGKTVCISAAKESVERDIKSFRCSSCNCDGYCKDGIGAEIGLILCTVSFDHCRINSICIESIHADDGICDHGVDILYGLGNTFAEIAGLIPVAEFECFEFAG